MAKLIRLAVILTLVGCTNLWPARLDCKQVAGSDLRSKIGEVTSAEQLRVWIGNAYQLPASRIQADVIRSGQLETVEWQKGGITYRGYVKGGHLTDVTVSYGSRRPSAGQVIACLGTPERYQASYEQNVEGNQLSLDLLFAAEGTLAYGARFMHIDRKQPPPVDGSFPIFGLAIVEPGTADQVLREIYESNETYEQMLRAYRPWPGDWQSVVIDIDPALAK
jgi:hypothetical protein